MRDIEFRGKSKKSNTWAYGCYFYLQKEDKHYIFGETKDYGFQDIEVVVETVGQYTGLKDKNDVKIFEGDLYRHEFVDITYTVIWHHTGLVGKENGINSYEGIFYRIKDIEVIGNIHDNKEYGVLKKDELESVNEKIGDV